MIKERITVVFPDHCVFVDEELRKFPLEDVADLVAHALHWFPETQSGVIEYEKEANLPFTDERIVAPFLAAWLAEGGQVDALTKGPKAADWADMQGKRQPAQVQALVDALKDSILAARETAEEAQRQREADFQAGILSEAERRRTEKQEQDRIRFEKMVELKRKQK
jgi:hypothetical protein